MINRKPRRHEPFENGPLEAALLVALLLGAPTAMAQETAARQYHGFTITLPTGFSWLEPTDAESGTSGQGAAASDSMLVARGGEAQSTAVMMAVLDSTRCPMSVSCIDETVAANIAAMEREGARLVGVIEKRVETVDGVRAGRVVVDAEFPSIGRQRVLMYFIPHETRLLGLTYMAPETYFIQSATSFDVAAHLTQGAKELSYDPTSAGGKLGAFLGRLGPVALIIPLLLGYGAWLLLKRGISWLRG